MELSHSHRFIFVHVYRTGGQSVSAALQPYTFEPDRLARTPVIGMLGDRRIHLLREHYYGHVKAKELQDGLPPAMFDSFYKFSFARNPWDWQVSIYHYIRQRARHPEHRLFNSFRGFEDYLNWRIFTKGVELQSEFVLSESGELLVDFVGHHEVLARDFRAVAGRVGIDPALPHRNRSTHRDFREYYTPDTRALVADAYQKDIEYFGYTFEPQPDPEPIVAKGARLARSATVPAASSP